MRGACEPAVGTPHVYKRTSIGKGKSGGIGLFFVSQCLVLEGARRSDRPVDTRAMSQHMIAVLALCLCCAQRVAALPTSASGGCADSTRLMPACTECIPGLHGPNCEKMSQTTTKLRNQLHRISAKRYGKESSCHLYPYLESPQLQGRQALLAQWMATSQPQHILDIGP